MTMEVTHFAVSGCENCRHIPLRGYWKAVPESRLVSYPESMNAGLGTVTVLCPELVQGIAVTELETVMVPKEVQGRAVTELE